MKEATDRKLEKQIATDEHPFDSVVEEAQRRREESRREEAIAKAEASLARIDNEINGYVGQIRNYRKCVALLKARLHKANKRRAKFLKTGELE